MSKKEVSFDALDALLQYKTSKTFCADYLGVSEDTLERRIKEQHGLSFGEYQRLKAGRMAVKLQQKAIEMALGGDRTMLIFSLKNLAGWADKLDHGVNEESKEALKLVYSVK